MTVAVIEVVSLAEALKLPVELAELDLELLPLLVDERVWVSEMELLAV